MAPAIVHFLVGAAILLVLAAPIALRYDLGRTWPLWLVIVGGLWGLFPDIHHIAPAYESHLRTLHDSPWADLFAFHYTLDRPAVRTRYTESVFLSILLFVGATVTYTIGDALGDRRTVDDDFALPLSATILVAGLGTLLIGTVLVGAQSVPVS